MTSSTFTDMARIPGGIEGGRPAPDPIGASLVSVSGSFSATAATRPRSTIGLTSENVPGTGFLAGQATSLTSFSVIRDPVGRLRAATATNVCATSTSRTGTLLTAAYTPRLAIVAVTVAKAITTTVRVVRFMLSPRLLLLRARGCRAFVAHPCGCGQGPGRESRTAK